MELLKNDTCSIDAAGCRDAAERLHKYLQRHMRQDGSLTGPDPGVRLNLRVGRFVKSYLRWLPWNDDRYYLQGQAYWIMDNLAFYKMTGRDKYLEMAQRCAEIIAANQTDEGYWEYPQGGWHGMIATVENCFAGLALLKAFSVTGEQKYLQSVERWYAYMIDKVGFQSYDGESLAINYFANCKRGLVPNNSTLAIWFCAELSQASGDSKYMEYCPAMINFLERSQLKSGELPYSIESDQGAGHTHYLCYQYNAFQLMDLMEYTRIAGDNEVREIARKVAEFVACGLTPGGDARRNCHKDRPIVHYYTAAVSAALLIASEAGLGDYWELAAKGFSRLLSVQRRDGGFDYSWGDYGLLADRRSYPRNQAMILMHLIAGTRTSIESGKDGRR